MPHQQTMKHAATHLANRAPSETCFFMSSYMPFLDKCRETGSPRRAAIVSPSVNHIMSASQSSARSSWGCAGKSARFVGIAFLVTSKLPRPCEFLASEKATVDATVSAVCLLPHLPSCQTHTESLRIPSRTCRQRSTRAPERGSCNMR